MKIKWNSNDVMVKRRIVIEGRKAQEDTYQALITSKLGGYFLRGLDLTYLERREGVALLLDGSSDNVNRLYKNLKRRFAESSTSSRIGQLEPYEGHIPTFSKFVETHVRVYTALQLSAALRAETALNESLRPTNEQLHTQVKEIEGIGEKVQKIGESVRLEILKTNK